jgi:hypothetical protein
MFVWKCRTDWNSGGAADNTYTRSLCCVIAISCRSLPASLCHIIYCSPPSQHAKRSSGGQWQRIRVKQNNCSMCFRTRCCEVSWFPWSQRLHFISLLPVSHLLLSEFRQDKRCTKDTSNITLWNSVMSCSCWTAQACLVAIKLTPNNTSGKSAWKPSDIDT